MTAINQTLQRTTYPIRRPYVRETTFIDGIGPPPYGFFDETQAHIGGMFHPLFGWNATADSDEFTEIAARAGYFGRLRITRSVGTFTAGPTPSTSVTEHGVWINNADDALPFSWTAEGGSISLDGDFLLTAKVKVMAPDHLDPAQDRGFLIGLGPVSGMGQYPCISCGGDGPNWRALYSPDSGSAQVADDTGIPALAGHWYRLQISRVAGAVRFFINGALVRFASGLEGVYYPDRLLNARKIIEIARSNTGPIDEAFYIDSFHLRAERATS